MLITARTNPQVKRWRALAQDSRARRQANLVWLEGEHLFRAAQQAAWVIETLISVDLPLAAPCTALQQAQVSPGVMAALSQLDSPSNCAALVRMPAALPISLITTDALILDGLQDPGNLGTILRCAWAFGWRRVLLTPGSASAWSLKALRAGQGAQFFMQIDEAVLPEAIASLLRVPLLATSLQAASALPNVDLRGPQAWVFGHEGQGVSPQLLALADTRVLIPMPGMAESLNVAAACAVCLYEAMRQRR